MWVTLLFQQGCVGVKRASAACPLQKCQGWREQLFPSRHPEASPCSSRDGGVQNGTRTPHGI